MLWVEIEVNSSDPKHMVDPTWCVDEVITPVRPVSMIFGGFRAIYKRAQVVLVGGWYVDGDAAQ